MIPRVITIYIYCVCLVLFFCLYTSEKALALNQPKVIQVPNIREVMITPADVYKKFTRINQTINKLGTYMGVLSPKPLRVYVDKVTPVDLYFQARNLYETINRLSFEILREQDRNPVTITLEGINPSHINGLAELSLKLLDRVANKFDIEAPISQHLTNNVSLKDIYFQIIESKRYLNILLMRRYMSGDVYQQINLSIGYAARLLDFYEAPELIPPTPDFIAGKTPIHVYDLLFDCLEVLSKIYTKTELKMIELKIDNIDKEAITPGDVYDLSSLIVARLHFFNQIAGVNKLPRKVYSPGLKFPSHVYAQSGILLDQLRQLLSIILKR